MSKHKRQGIRKRGKVWYVRVQKNGIRKDIPVGTTVVEAIKAYRQYKYSETFTVPANAAPTPTPAPIPPQNTFGQAVDEYWQNHLQFTKSAKTKVKCYLKGFRALFETRDISTIQWQELEAYKNKRLTQVKPSVVKKELIYAGAIFKRQIKFGKLTANPMELVSKPKVQDARERILNKDEFKRLLNVTWVADNRGWKMHIAIKNHLRLALVIADFTAMRLGEILRLQWDHIDLKQGIIYIPESKNGRKRFVPIHLELKKILAAQIRESPYVIHFRGRPIAVQIRMAFNRARDAAGIKDFRFHDLRHRAITRWVQEGKPVDVIRKVSGHSTYSAFSRYSNLQDGDIMQLIGKKTKPLPVVTFKEFFAFMPEKMEQKSIEKVAKSDEIPHLS